MHYRNLHQMFGSFVAYRQNKIQAKSFFLKEHMETMENCSMDEVQNKC